MTWQRVRLEFESLLALGEPARTARLRELESTDQWLAEQVRELLQHDTDAASFLERPPEPTAVVPEPASAGRRLGRFELLQPLGSGGMGAVWLAQQQDPERRVALKVVGRGACSEAERWRFRHEAQVLAGLNHAGIATFFEAGTDVLDGHEVAWFAMELVDGATDVLTWAQKSALSRDERLDLFLRLCEAVEYGHRRGVLHRDLKPGNVLVSRDGQLKLIDFGIARALQGAAVAPAARTQTGEMVGTVQYMAPEQLLGRADSIGTASDVYALGMLLYHLLCERAPFDFEGVPFARIAELVLEREPLAPTAARPELPKDLGWILVRALEKDPTRRYATVSALVADIARFASHEPVWAGPPSSRYRLQKFVRRHRLAVGVLGTVLAGLGAGVWGLWHGLTQAHAGELAAQQGEQAARRGEATALRAADLSREVARVLVSLFDGIDDTIASREMTVHELLDASDIDERAAADPAVEYAVREVRGTVYARLHRYPEARRELEQARELRGQRAAQLAESADGAFWHERGLALDARLGRVLVASGERERGWQLVRDAVAGSAQASPAARIAVLRPFCALLAEARQDAELLPWAQQVSELARGAGNESTALEADVYAAEALLGLGRHGEARALAEQSWRAATELHGSAHARTLRALATYVAAAQGSGDAEAAEELYPALVEGTRALYGPDHTNTLTVLGNQCTLLLQRGKRRQALDGLREVVRIYDARGAGVDQNHLAAISNLGMLLDKTGRSAEAEPVLARAAGLTREVLDARDPNGPIMRINHAVCLAALKRWAEAEPLLRAEYANLERLLPAGHPVLAQLRRAIASAFEANGQREEAASWRAR
ncbi:MAG TPA: serine/threonine-protein kinase [Planctomycetota bacterium]|nr:serine/threonine-protein kinase [Planctomycetota bacterium]